MELVSMLLVLCGGYPPVTIPPKERGQGFHVWCKLEQSAKQTVELSVIWDAMALIWPYCNGLLKNSYVMSNKAV